LREDGSASGQEHATAQLLATRPTAVNLSWALEQVNQALWEKPEEHKYDVALARAYQLMNDDIEVCDQIGQHGLGVLREINSNKQGIADQPLNIMTHCNAGWLATIGIGTALAPVYKAVEAGLNIHVWVSETRPRNQGAALTAWELEQAGVSYTVIADNAAGHLMQTGQVDVCLVGSDRTTSRGDVCNKIGTYMKAVVARENNIPFYAALPVSTIDWQINNGLREIVIEQRSSKEVTHINGKYSGARHGSVLVTPEAANVSNYAFDVTPAKLITGLITEYGVYNANEEDLQKLKNLSR